ncbi:MAG TPA: 50S ribosomal protein L10 [Clostridia bacterium]|nr:50S ribosomal protein L10 [Clostridia bacterium]
MSANLEAKKALAQEMTQKIAKAQSIILIDYKGISVEMDTELRTRFRKAGVEYKVCKNSIFLRSAKENNIEGLDEYLKGTTSFAFGYDDPVAPAKIIESFMKEKNILQVKCGIVNNTVVDAKSVKALAALPSKEVLIAQVLGTLNAPIAGLARVLSGTLCSLLYTLNAIKEKKEAN